MRDYLMDEVNTYYALLTVAVAAIFAGALLVQAIRLNTFDIIITELPAEEFQRTQNL